MLNKKRNNWDLLADPTGSRRFVCIEINGNIRPDRSVEYGQLYAQAVAALWAGERYWFTPEAFILFSPNAFSDLQF
ncbi:VapE domain-containing protein [Parabacteroides merdae]|uniref:VapE domain-containing protein n=1 Tax=Parabacteroides merdae TaxID=46503 RepID=UPI003561D7F7